MELILSVIFIYLLGRYVLLGQISHHRELSRFCDVHEDKPRSLDDYYMRLLQALGGFGAGDKKSSLSNLTLGAQGRDIELQLRHAGLSGAIGRGRYVLVRLLCYASWPVIVVSAWRYWPPYYATVTSIFSFAIIVLLPYVWLKKKVAGRKESIQRELPLFIDLTNLACSAGYDISAALERVIDALAPEFPDHPLIVELKRARWLVSQGYTWGEALDRITDRVDDETVDRVTKSLKQAIEQGGDRSGQLAGIAEDAQRVYYSFLDRRLAVVPLKVLMVSMVLFLTYFTILFAPAAVGVANTLEFF